MIEPDSRAAANADAGEVVELIAFAETTTDGDGRAVLRLDPAALPATAFVDRDTPTTVNTSVHAFHEQSRRFGVWHVPLDRPTGGNNFWTDSVDATSAPEVTIELVGP